MKKITFFLLAASASSSFLFAQAQNRLEVRGDRLEMPLQRQEMEDRRWKMEVEDQGCSFQKVEGRIINENEDNAFDNQSLLLANDSVPISHLPSSISYLGVTPKLMMNPAELKNIREGVEELIVSSEKEFPIPLTGVSTIVETGSSVASSSSNSSKATVLGKRKAVEEAFSRAQTAKSEDSWNEARTTAQEASMYWDSVVEEMKLGRQPLAMEEAEARIQRDYLAQKEGVAEVKALGAKPCGVNWAEKHKRPNELMTMVKNKVWPTVSQTMKEFCEHPSEAKMLAVREAITAYAYAIAYTTTIANTNITTYAYASAYSPAYAYAYVSMSPGAYAAMYAYDYASAPVIAYATAFAASATTIEEATDAEKLVEAILEAPTSAALTARINAFDPVTQAKMDWIVNSTSEVAAFAQAVVKYQTEKEGCSEEAVPEWKKKVEKIFNQAYAAKNQSSWKAAAVAAKEASSYCHQMGETKQENYWEEKANIAEIRALEVSSNPADHQENLKKTNEIMKIIRTKIGSPVSNAMKEFIAHPSEATINAIPHYSSKMSAAEVAEAAGIAEVFLEMSTYAADFAKAKKVDEITQENYNWAVVIAREVSEYTRALATFKAGKEVEGKKQG